MKTMEFTEDFLAYIPEGIQMLQQGSSLEELTQLLLDEIDQTFEDFPDLPERLTTLLKEMATALEASPTSDQAISALAGFQQQLQALPPPKRLYQSHGTSVAGVAAATGNNGIGVTGVAPEASLAGLKILLGELPAELGINPDDPSFPEWEDQQQAKALSYKNQEIDIYNNSWGPTDPLEGPGPKALGRPERKCAQGTRRFGKHLCLGRWQWPRR